MSGLLRERRGKGIDRRVGELGRCILVWAPTVLAPPLYCRRQWGHHLQLAERFLPRDLERQIRISLYLHPPLIHRIQSLGLRT